jgi:hypothetical protein
VEVVPTSKRVESTANTTLELVSVHLPKTAGHALRRVLERHYGDEAVMNDYDDNPASPISQFQLDPNGFRRRCELSNEMPGNGYRAVHGHFHPDKYNSLKSVVRITFLRDPVSRLLSHYFFWLALPDTAEASNNPLHTYMLQQNLSILEFAKLPIIRYFTTRVFFGGVDMTDFDLIGRQENYANDLKTLCRLIGYKNGTNEYVNANPDPGYQDRVSPRTVSELRAILADEIEFYNRWSGRGIDWL